MVVFYCMMPLIAFLVGTCVWFSFYKQEQIQGWLLVLTILILAALALVIFEFSRSGGWTSIFAIWFMVGAVVGVWIGIFKALDDGVHRRQALLLAGGGTAVLFFSFELGYVITKEQQAVCAVPAVIEAIETYHSVKGVYPTNIHILDESVYRAQHPMRIWHCSYKGYRTSLSDVHYVYNSSTQNYYVAYAYDVPHTPIRRYCSVRSDQPLIRCSIGLARTPRYGY